MSSSQITSGSEKKSNSIIDGRLLSQSVVIKRVQDENEDIAAMESVISKIKQSGLFKLGCQHSDIYDESLVEEFYQEASVRFRSDKKGGDVAGIYATVRGVEICINRRLLKDLFSLPSSGLKLEELETFGSEDLLTSFWCIFIGDTSDTKVHPSCNKKRFTLPFLYLHEFCCRVVENRTGAFDMCTNLRFRMMVAIMANEPVNWCQVILKRLQEEVSKPLTQKKSFGLILNNIFSCLDVPFAQDSKKIGSGKFIGGYKPTSYNKSITPADRPSIPEIPLADASVDQTADHTAVKSQKRKHRKSPRVAPQQKKRKLKKAMKSKPTAVSAPTVEEHLEDLLEDQTADGIDGKDSASAFPESVAISPVRVSTPAQDPSPNRVPTPARDPSPNRAPTPVRTPSSEQDPTPVPDPNPTVIPIPVRSPSPTQIINDSLLSIQVEDAYERFLQWKSFRLAVRDLLYNWEDWEVEERFVMEVTGSSDVAYLIHSDNSLCHELIMKFHIAQAEASRKGKTTAPDAMSSSSSDDSDNDDDALQAGLRMSREDADYTAFRSFQASEGQGTSIDQISPTPQVQDEEILQEAPIPVQPDTIQQAELVAEDESRAIPHEEAVPLPDQADAERQQEDSVPPVPLSTETQPQPHAANLSTDAQASPCSQPIVVSTPEDHSVYPTQHAALLMLPGLEEQVARPGSPRSEIKKDSFAALGSHTVFIQDAVDVLRKIERALDWLNVSATEELGSTKSVLSNVAEALQALPQVLKVALSNIQQRKQELLEKEQAKYRTFEVRTAIALKESGTKLTGHDKNLDNLSLSLQTLAGKFSNIEEKQEDVVNLIHSIDSHVSEIHARKGEEESREAARRWRRQKEAELEAALEDDITAAINRLGSQRQGYRVSGTRPEFHDPNVPWKQLVSAPNETRLPTDRQPSPEEIKQWKKNELMRYFVKLIKESTIFDRCKTLSEAATEFTARLEKGVLPLQLTMISKHKKGDRISHPEDWILSYDKSYEGRAIYLNRGRDALVNWWKHTEFDPSKHRPWRHDDQYRR
ncbi:hypothetical protein OROMI_024250 [Orobanche minor]